MVDGKKVLVFSPINKGWGTSTTAVALSVMLEQEYSGRILLMDFFMEISAIEHYLKKDMSKHQESLPFEIFANSFDAEKLMLFCRPISKSLYFFKIDCERFIDEYSRQMAMNRLISEAGKIFDIVIIKTDSRLTKEVNSRWDVGVSISSFENGFDKIFEKGSSFNWYRELLKKQNCLKVVNGVPYDGTVRESVKEYITGKERAYLLPYNGELILGGNIGSRLYSGLREELLTNRSLYSKKIGKVTNRILEIADLRNSVREDGKRLGTY